MRVDEARQIVLDLITADVAQGDLPVVVDPSPPSGLDPSMFRINDKVARPIHHYSGWNVPIDLGWFTDKFDEPRIHGQPFYWYAFAIPKRSRYLRDHYLLCDFLQVREWVRDFRAPLGRDHRDHRFWRADLRIYVNDGREQEGYFRWGDEPVGEAVRPDRVFELDNVATIADAALIGARVGALARGGESAAHRQLKLYVASHPQEFGLSSHARPHVEYRFQTGDRVDVLFENHVPDRTVVEVEIEGSDNICVGIHQAIKYRTLAEADSGYPLLSSRVGSLVVAYDTDYAAASALADRYDIRLQSVDRDVILASAV